MSPTPLEIKTKALGRLVKEYFLYQEELLSQQNHIQALKSQIHDEYEIRKQVEVALDTERVMSEVLKKIRESYENLNEVANRLDAIPESTEDILMKARRVIS